MRADGIVAWVPVSSCWDLKQVDDCDKTAHAPFHQGRVTTTFELSDDYIPCYLPPMSTEGGAQPAVFHCFSNILLSVHDAPSHNSQ